MSKVLKYHIDYSSETKRKVTQLYIDDLTKQIEKLKKSKDLFAYNVYRYIYMRMHNQLSAYIKKLNNIK